MYLRDTDERRETRASRDVGDLLGVVSEDTIFVFCISRRRRRRRRAAAGGGAASRATGALHAVVARALGELLLRHAGWETLARRADDADAAREADAAAAETARAELVVAHEANFAQYRATYVEQVAEIVRASEDVEASIAKARARARDDVAEARAAAAARVDAAERARGEASAELGRVGAALRDACARRDASLAALRAVQHLLWGEHARERGSGGIRVK